MIFSHVLRDSTPRYYRLLVGRSVGRLVGWSVFRSLFYFFWRFWAFWAYSSCPDALVTFSSTASAHPHATRVAVYPALFPNKRTQRMGNWRTVPAPLPICGKLPCHKRGSQTLRPACHLLPSTNNNNSTCTKPWWSKIEKGQNCVELYYNPPRLNRRLHTTFPIWKD